MGRKPVLWLSGLACVLLAVVVLTLRPAAVLVEVVPVKRGSLRVTVDEEGETRVRDRYVVAAPISGRLQRFDLREGDSLVEG